MGNEKCSGCDERKALGSPKSGPELLDMYYLELRCNLLEAAATFDRIQRAEQGEAAYDDPRMKKILAALDILKADTPDRAERFLQHFSE